MGNTKDVVNWGLMTYSGTSAVCGGSTEVNPPSSGIQAGGVPVVTIDTGPGDVKKIEGYMRLRFLGGLATVNWTPTKSAIAAANDSLLGIDAIGTNGTWGADPKKACNRAYGVILCTDGQSNICNTGTSALGPDWEWDNPTAPTACEIDTGGTDFTQLPSGCRGSHVPERAPVAGGRHHPGPDVRDRNLARHLTLRAEPHRVSRPHRRELAEQGRRIRPLGQRSDPGPAGGGGDAACRMSTAPETAATTVPTNESGPSLPASPVGASTGSARTRRRRTTTTTPSSRTTPRRSRTPST